MLITGHKLVTPASCAEYGPVAKFFRLLGEPRVSAAEHNFWLQGRVLRRSNPYLWLRRNRVGRAQFPHKPCAENFATCVDARSGARRIFGIGAARGRVLTCVRPLMRLTRRGPGWEFADQVQVRPTRLKRLSQSWFSRSRLSDRSAIPLL